MSRARPNENEGFLVGRLSSDGDITVQQPDPLVTNLNDLWQNPETLQYFGRASRTAALDAMPLLICMTTTADLNEQIKKATAEAEQWYDDQSRGGDKAKFRKIASDTFANRPDLQNLPQNLLYLRLLVQNGPRGDLFTDEMKAQLHLYLRAGQDVCLVGGKRVPATDLEAKVKLDPMAHTVDVSQLTVEERNSLTAKVNRMRSFLLRHNLMNPAFLGQEEYEILKTRFLAAASEQDRPTIQQQFAQIEAKAQPPKPVPQPVLPVPGKPVPAPGHDTGHGGHAHPEPPKRELTADEKTKLEAARKEAEQKADALSTELQGYLTRLEESAKQQGFTLEKPPRLTQQTIAPVWDQTKQYPVYEYVFTYDKDKTCKFVIPVFSKPDGNPIEIIPPIRQHLPDQLFAQLVFAHPKDLEAHRRFDALTKQGKQPTFSFWDFGRDMKEDLEGALNSFMKKAKDGPEGGKSKWTLFWWLLGSGSAAVPTILLARELYNTALGRWDNLLTVQAYRAIRDRRAGSQTMPGDQPVLDVVETAESKDRKKRIVRDILDDRPEITRAEFREEIARLKAEEDAKGRQIDQARSTALNKLLYDWTHKFQDNPNALAYYDAVTNAGIEKAPTEADMVAVRKQAGEVVRSRTHAGHKNKDLPEILNEAEKAARSTSAANETVRLARLRAIQELRVRYANELAANPEASCLRTVNDWAGNPEPDGDAKKNAKRRIASMVHDQLNTDGIDPLEASNADVRDAYEKVQSRLKGQKGAPEAQIIVIDGVVNEATSLANAAPNERAFWRLQLAMGVPKRENANVRAEIANNIRLKLNGDPTAKQCYEAACQAMAHELQTHGDTRPEHLTECLNLMDEYRREFKADPNKRMGERLCADAALVNPLDATDLQKLDRQRTILREIVRGDYEGATGKKLPDSTTNKAFYEYLLDVQRLEESLPYDANRRKAIEGLVKEWKVKPHGALANDAVFDKLGVTLDTNPGGGVDRARARIADTVIFPKLRPGTDNRDCAGRWQQAYTDAQRNRMLDPNERKAFNDAIGVWTRRAQADPEGLCGTEMCRETGKSMEQLGYDARRVQAEVEGARARILDTVRRQCPGTFDYEELYKLWKDTLAAERGTVDDATCRAYTDELKKWKAKAEDPATKNKNAWVEIQEAAGIKPDGTQLKTAREATVYDEARKLISHDTKVSDCLPKLRAARDQALATAPPTPTADEVARIKVLSEYVDAFEALNTANPNGLAGPELDALAAKAPPDKAALDVARKTVADEVKKRGNRATTCEEWHRHWEAAWAAESGPGKPYDPARIAIFNEQRALWQTRGQSALYKAQSGWLEMSELTDGKPVTVDTTRVSKIYDATRAQLKADTPISDCLTKLRAERDGLPGTDLEGIKAYQQHIDLLEAQPDQTKPAYVPLDDAQGKTPKPTDVTAGRAAVVSTLRQPANISDRDYQTVLERAAQQEGAKPGFDRVQLEALTAEIQGCRERIAERQIFQSFMNKPKGTTNREFLGMLRTAAGQPANADPIRQQVLARHIADWQALEQTNPEGRAMARVLDLAGHPCTETLQQAKERVAREQFVKAREAGMPIYSEAGWDPLIRQVEAARGALGPTDFVRTYEAMDALLADLNAQRAIADRTPITVLRDADPHAAIRDSFMARLVELGLADRLLDDTTRPQVRDAIQNTPNVDATGRQHLEALVVEMENQLDKQGDSIEQRLTDVTRLYPSAMTPKTQTILIDECKWWAKQNGVDLESEQADMRQRAVDFFEARATAIADPQDAEACRRIAQQLRDANPGKLGNCLDAIDLAAAPANTAVSDRPQVERFWDLVNDSVKDLGQDAKDTIAADPEQRAKLLEDAKRKLAETEQLDQEAEKTIDRAIKRARTGNPPPELTAILKAQGAPNRLGVRPTVMRVDVQVRLRDVQDVLAKPEPGKGVKVALTLGNRTYTIQDEDCLRKMEEQYSKRLAKLEAMTRTPEQQREYEHLRDTKATGWGSDSMEARAAFIHKELAEGRMEFKFKQKPGAGPGAGVGVLVGLGIIITAVGAVTVLEVKKRIDPPTRSETLQQQS